MADTTDAPKFEPVCGLNEEGVDAFLQEAEQLDKGTDRFPWPDEFKNEVKYQISGMVRMDDVKRRINAYVVHKLGPGLLGRGPFNLPQVQ